MVSALECWIRPFIRALPGEGSDGWDSAHVVPLFEEHPEIVTELRALGRPEAAERRDVDALHGLYALSRLIDLVIAPFQPGDDDLGWPTAAPTVWADVRGAIGAVEPAEDVFHPFFHEIADVQPSDDPDEPVSVVAQLWPGALCGGLVLARAGVAVTAGSAVLDPVVAARSTQYWTWLRRHRPSTDLSEGWGSNSQWRTAFRRDYVLGEELHYNVDARHAEIDADLTAGLTAAQVLELLRFRHGTRVDLGADRWPYDQYLVEPRHGH